MILALLLALSPAFAGEIVTPVPRPESWAIVPPAPAGGPPADAGRLELGVAGWSPHSTKAPSRLAGTSDFEGSGLPELRVAYVTPAVLEGRLGSLSVRGGLGFAKLFRTAAVSALPGSTLGGSQEYYLLPLRAGAEWRPQSDLSRSWEPRLSASLLPTLGIATRSALNDGGAHLGIPAEVEAAVAIAPGKLVPLMATSLGDRTRPVFQLGASLRVGRVDWVSMSGLGVNAGLSIGL